VESARIAPAEWDAGQGRV